MPKKLQKDLLNKSVKQPSKSNLHIRAVHMPLFPTMGSLKEVMDLAQSQLPITSQNDINNILMIYQNTLLSELKKQS